MKQMKPIPLSLLLGVTLTGVSVSQSPPTALPRNATVSELGPAVTGNLLADPPSVAFYDFDAAPGVNDGADLDGWIDWIGESFPSGQVFSSGGANDGGRGTGLGRDSRRNAQ